ncbi:hypothetical protein ACIBG4_17455 [Nonomuraea sp. NPDC050383]|uniref:hypothetical protein n=1 Tax=Nonomuraea sp. NPDC050383 TaxID=3364362 RepID=UPI0037929819
MSDNHDEHPEPLPGTVTGLNAESDVVAERSGAGTSRSGRPIPADPPEAQAASEAEAGAGAGEDAGEEAGAEPDEEGRTGGVGEEPEVRPDAGPTG